MPMNMGYCRFENTLMALQECAEAMSHANGRDWIADIGLSDREREAARKLMKLCGELAADYGDDPGADE